MKNDGSLIQEGNLLKNPKLARTFRRIAEDPMTYYKGSLAHEIVNDITDYGILQGLLSAYVHNFFIIALYINMSKEVQTKHVTAILFY